MAQNRQFLLADDDDLLRAAVAEQLALTMPCTVTGVGTLAQALAAVTRGPRFDAIMLDVRLPDGDGRDLCQRLRRAGCNTPVLMLTGARGESDIVRGLDAGANDYVCKPFRVAELAARLRAQIRSFEYSEHAEIPIGPFVFRPGTKQLHIAGVTRPIRLTEKESAVLKFLYRAAGAPIARETLLHEVWGYSAQASTHTVETHIYRLRRKIEQAPEGASLLVNDGGGYRLCLEREAPPRHLPMRPVRDMAPPEMALAG